MKREIKFEYGFQSVNGIVKKVYHLHEIPNIKEKCDVFNVLPIVYVRQFTGLKDKNGKEIYEGDIVKSVYGNGYIVFEYIGFAIKSIGSESIDFEFPSFYLNCEIIGNIYENPELL